MSKIVIICIYFNSPNGLQLFISILIEKLNYPFHFFVTIRNCVFSPYIKDILI